MAESLVPTGAYHSSIYTPSSLVVDPALINCYSVLTLPGYKQGVAFLANNLAGFDREVRKDWITVTTPHAIEKLINRKPNSYQNANLAFFAPLRLRVLASKASASPPHSAAPREPFEPVLLRV